MDDDDFFELCGLTSDDTFGVVDEVQVAPDMSSEKSFKPSTRKNAVYECEALRTEAHNDDMARQNQDKARTKEILQIHRTYVNEQLNDVSMKPHKEHGGNCMCNEKCIKW